MFKLYPEQLCEHLNKGLHTVYMLIGNDHLLLQESKDIICQLTVARGFKKYPAFQIDNNDDWQKLFSLCREMNLFAVRNILQIYLPEKSNNVDFNKNMNTLVELLHDNLLLIIIGKKLTKMQKDTVWFNQLVNNSVLVVCQAPEQDDMITWVADRAKKNGIQLNNAACRLLCCYYEGNLQALTQILERLALMWPGSKLTLNDIEQVVNDVSCFTSYHWVDSLLRTETKRALHILKQLRFAGNEPIILLRTIQHEVLLLLSIKRQLKHTSLQVLLDKHRILYNRRTLIAKAVNILNQDQLRQAIQLMTHIELTLKHDYDQSVWSKLESLTLLLCHKPLARIFIDG